MSPANQRDHGHMSRTGAQSWPDSSRDAAQRQRSAHADVSALAAISGLLFVLRRPRVRHGPGTQEPDHRPRLPACVPRSSISSSKRQILPRSVDPPRHADNVVEPDANNGLSTGTGPTCPAGRITPQRVSSHDQQRAQRRRRHPHQGPPRGSGPDRPSRSQHRRRAGPGPHQHPNCLPTTCTATRHLQACQPARLSGIHPRRRCQLGPGAARTGFRSEIGNLLSSAGSEISSDGLVTWSSWETRSWDSGACAAWQRRRVSW